MSPPLNLRVHCALFTTPRQIVFTRMLSGAYSFESDFVRLIPAARVRDVGSALGSGVLPPIVVTLMIAPPPRFFIEGMTARAKRIAPITFRSKSYCHVSSSTSRNAPACDVPALFSSMSTPPQRPSVSSTSFVTCACFVTSVGSAKTSAPVAFWTSFAAASRTSGRRAHMTTFAPHCASFSAAALPSPSLAPVRIATLPLSPSSSVSMAGDDTTADVIVRAMPESIPAPLVIDTLKDTFKEARAALAKEGWRNPTSPYLGWILSVPDTHQKTVLAALDKEEAIKTITCATEDEACTIAGGLYMGGEPVVLMIQHAGLYASVNTLRGVSMDGKIPVFYMIGLLSREKDKDPKDSRHSMVRYAEPLLDTFSVPHARLEGPDDVHVIPEYYRLSRQRKGPTAVLVRLETS